MSHYNFDNIIDCGDHDHIGAFISDYDITVELYGDTPCIKIWWEEKKRCQNTVKMRRTGVGRDGTYSAQCESVVLIGEYTDNIPLER